jgi:3-oxoacyl-[acyl-carrier protein] reductase
MKRCSAYDQVFLYCSTKLIIPKLPARNGGRKIRKVVYVTGGSSGIGGAIVLVFAKNGYDVALGYFKDKESADKVSEDAKKLGAKTLVLDGDLSVEKTVQDNFSEIKKIFGRLDVLVNVAGGVPSEAQIPDTTREHWVEIFDANLFSTVLCSQEAIKIMRNQNEIGKIINIASVLGEPFGGRAGAIAYAAAKSAVINFTQTLAKQVVPKILVNAVSPGRTHTPYYDRMDPEKRAKLMSANRIGRFVNPEEIASMVLEIAQNDGITGETVSVNGGFFLWER